VIQRQRRDPLLCDSIQDLDAGKAPHVIGVLLESSGSRSAQALTGAHPDGVAVDGERHDVLRRESVSGGVTRDTAVLEPPETTLATRAGSDSNPEPLPVVACDGRDEARQLVRVCRRVVHEPSAAQRRQPGLGTDPQHTGTVGVQRADHLPGSEALRRHDCEPVALQVREPVVRAYPETAVAIGGQRSDSVARQAVLGIEGGEATVLETGQAAPKGPDPEGRGAIFGQRPDLALPELSR
jgi:hypothetical protein